MAGSPLQDLGEERLEDVIPLKKAPLTESEAVVEARRCLYCYDAPCIRACPTHIDVPTFIRRIATGQPEGAARTILDANLLGKSCAQACPVEVLCEGSCVYVGWGRPAIEIGRLQSFAMDHALETSFPTRRPKTGHSMGLIGAGPASLACAARLVLLGHEATIYERLQLPGGLNTHGIAPYKLPSKDAMAEIRRLLDLGIRLETGVEFGKDVDGRALLARHAAIFVGFGLGDDSLPPISGIESEGVYGATHFIRRMKTEPGFTLRGITNAFVAGGGNTALDVVRELRALGVPSVTLVLRRSRADLRAYAHEWAASQEEGVAFLENAAVSAIRSREGRVSELELVRTTADGRLTGEALPSQKAELLVFAIGQGRQTRLISSLPEVRADDRGRIQVDSDGRTGNPRVFAGGDACNGGSEVVDAVADGQRAADAIHRMLSSKAS